mmetsp:Transcript_57850/g.135831  ORF Transcript_57850/g.135831 Transcript_57850/m.135831 type:complete len:207 (+) Transcript_57850:1282-1902(+)
MRGSGWRRGLSTPSSARRAAPMAPTRTHPCATRSRTVRRTRSPCMGTQVRRGSRSKLATRSRSTATPGTVLAPTAAASSPAPVPNTTIRSPAASPSLPAAPTAPSHTATPLLKATSRRASAWRSSATRGSRWTRTTASGTRSHAASWTSSPADSSSSRARRARRYPAVSAATERCARTVSSARRSFPQSVASSTSTETQQVQRTAK